MPADLASELRRIFGFSRFKEPQEEIIRDMLAGRDVLVVLPTGGGKSLCYQLPALLSEGLTLVVSPLIALMKDQVDVLRERGAPVAVFHSLQSAAERAETLGLLSSGRCRLLYVAPERFRAGGFLDAIRRQRIDRFAVDEAHCLSQWGHDFRPDYLRLGEAVEALGRPPVAAFTATATPVVRDDIVAQLRLRDPVIRVSGFSRPNLAFRVRRVSGEREKMEAVRNLVRRWSTGIIYCATRKKVEKVSKALADEGASVISYHGGMEGNAREEAQNRFMAREYNVAVATNAFGMGIDRADVRFVVHYELPGSPEAYYQEAGRAGRDGDPAECELLYNYADRRTQEFFIEGSNPDPKLIRRVYDTLRDLADARHEVRIPVDDLVDTLPGRENPMAVSTAVGFLARTGAVERFDIPGRRRRGTRILHPDRRGAQLSIDAEALRTKRRRDEEKLEAVIRFCEHVGACRQQWILDYFGEKSRMACGKCDCCDAREDPDLRPPTEEEQLLARQALSGVARMATRTGARSWEPRFGKSKIVDCLLGKEPGGPTGPYLESLSTFGLLADQPRKRLQELFRELEKRRYVQTESSGGFPLLGLSERGVEVLLDGQPCHLDWDALPAVKQTGAARNRTSRKGEAAAGLPPEHADLFAALRELRREIAAQRGVPAFTVFHDRTLADLATERPMTVDEALRIKGIGPAKVGRELPLFLEKIREWGSRQQDRADE
ncbi:MAG: RecQ family ATP-dependent DNA helicase [Puniceicoccaceae bacterium]